jgi:flavodoxin
MKQKILGTILTFICVAALFGCGNAQASQSTGSAVQETKLASQTAATAVSKTESAKNAEAETNVVEEAADGSKILVVYFSCTNTTKRAAQTIAAVTGADIFEIEAADPYTPEDINYHNDNSRTSIEQNDSLVRPEIANQISDMDRYEYIFIGSPIWWGEEPRIMDTFVESYDFTGKTLIPFCTSGGSGIGTAESNLKKLAKGSPEWKAGRRLSGNISEQEIASWIDELGIEGNY